MLLLRSLKPIQRWRTFIAILFAVIVINFASVPRVYAAWCLFGCLNADISGSVKFPSNAEFKKMGQELAKGIREELEKTNFKGMGQQFGEGLRKEFEAAMDRLFDEKIKPLVVDIDKLLKARLDQTDKMAKDRLAQLDKMIADRLKQVDDLIQATFERFQVVADKIIAKVKTDLIDHGANTFKKVTDETVAKFKADIIDHTFKQLDDLRRNFRVDVDHFFNKTEYLINTIDCKVAGTLEKIRNNLETIGKKLERLEGLSLEVNIKGSLMSGYSGDVSIKSDSTSPLKKPLSQCYQELGLTKPPEPLEYSSIYDLYKCEILTTLSQRTPIRRILNVYLDLKAQAARMACVQRGAGHHATLHYTWDWLEFGYWYDFWYAYQ